MPVSEELGFGSTEPNEFRAAFATLAAFLIVGFLPLSAFVYDLAAPGDLDHGRSCLVPRSRASRLATARRSGSSRSRSVD